MQKPIISLINCPGYVDLPALFPKERRYISIIDSSIAEMYRSYFPHPQIVIDVSEECKSIKEVERLATLLLEMEADRETVIVAVGGGVITDLVGFVASTYMRGLPFIFVPTTLLAMVDASIGGKNGVNLGVYKNIIGVFRQPECTVVCPQFLQTLPQKEYRQGLAEMVKSFIIADRERYFDFMNLPEKERQEYKTIAPFITAAASIKRAIVESDPVEKGERKLLNLGHTFAHAIELVENISHGEAVGIGITLAAKLSVRLSLLDQLECNTIISGLEKIGLRTGSPVKMDQVTDGFKKDKKRSGDVIHFVLIKKIGEAVVVPLQIDKLKELLYDLS
ncbi:MAG: 3-dehydroquinate synthase [Prevotellaceae bacterium]|jgi:3-dehydroquinate synthase|nr:3-dehydroquinate synthase [Prevotellaceae bacterium]